MARVSRGVLTGFAWMAVATAFAASTAMAQQSKGGGELSGLEGVGQQAISVVLKQSVLDPTALVPTTGKPLPVSGKWSVGKEAPTACPQTTDACVLILYQVPEAGVSCEWVVRLIGDGSDGLILQQNEAATHYLLRKLSTAQAAELVLTRKQPQSPPVPKGRRWAEPVVLRVFVSGSGTPEKVIVLSGPPMLRSVAEDAMKDWTFKPLMAGTQSVRFETDVTFMFRTSEQGTTTVTSNP